MASFGDFNLSYRYHGELSLTNEGYMDRKEPQNDGVTPAQEYDTLRAELSESKKYVFERPLVIVGVGLGLLTTGAVTYGVVLAALLSGLLLFNFWFTVNRLMSAARIVAYIQVVLESGAEWIGWETSLREYRIWIKTELNAKQIVEDDLKKVSAAIPDALMYYPPIYQLHIGLVIVSIIAGAALTVDAPNPINILACAPLVTFAAMFAYYCRKWTPSTMRSLIERNVIIWTYALSLQKPEP